MKETTFKADLKGKLKDMFKGCVVLKNDPSCIQGIPDLLILWHDRWAALETKKGVNEPHRPNQDYYVEKLDSFSFARFIYPENEEEVLGELKYFMEGRSSKSPKR